MEVTNNNFNGNNHDNNLNGTQINLMDAIFKSDFGLLTQIKEDCHNDPQSILIALKTLKNLCNYSNIGNYKNKISKLPLNIDKETLELVKNIILHPAPQNRNEDYPYFDRSNLPNNFVIFSDFNKKPQVEERGLLSLSAKNDETSPTITKNSVIQYIKDVLNQELQQVKLVCKKNIKVMDTNDGIHLDAIRSAKGNINEIRLLLKGNVEICHKLFKEAVAKGDAITQIQLSHALFGIKWGNDQEKDFSSIRAIDLEEFSYYPKNFLLFCKAYQEAIGDKTSMEEINGYAKEVFDIAAAQKYLPAVLEITHDKWGFAIDSYGFAVQLRPFVGKGDKTLDFYFGNALKNGCEKGSELYYEGLYWILQSKGFIVKCPKDQSFEEFTKDHLVNIGGCYEYDGFIYCWDGVVLAPSIERWETFVREKLANVQSAGLMSYLFKYDPKQIKSLIDQ